MPYEQDGFIGLTRTPDYATAGTVFREYAQPADNDLLDAGTHECPHQSPFFPFEESTLVCPNTSAFDQTADIGFMTARWVLFGAFPEDLTLTERIALMPPFPDYVQVHVHGRLATSGGNNACPAPTDGGVVGACLDPVTGTLIFDAQTFTAAFEFGGDMTTGDPTIVAPSGVADAEFDGMLRRPVDGDSYSGDPTNDAYRTLIPWDEFIASPTVTITLQANAVHTSNRLNTGATVRLWWLESEVEAPPTAVAYVGAA